MSGWNYNIDEAPEDKTLWLTLENEDGSLKVVKSEICFHKTEGLKIRAWKPIEAWPSPAGPPPKPEQLKPSSTGHLQLILEVEKRTREIVAWEQKYEVKKRK
jgi:hypothetical protein